MNDCAFVGICALMMATHCVELLVNVLDEDQQLQAKDGIYESWLAGIECYEMQASRLQQRLKPLSN